MCWGPMSLIGSTRSRLAGDRVTGDVLMNLERECFRTGEVRNKSYQIQPTSVLVESACLLINIKRNCRVRKTSPKSKCLREL